MIIAYICDTCRQWYPPNEGRESAACVECEGGKLKPVDENFQPRNFSEFDMWCAEMSDRDESAAPDRHVYRDMVHFNNLFLRYISGAMAQDCLSARDEFYNDIAIARAEAWSLIKQKLGFSGLRPGEHTLWQVGPIHLRTCAACGTKVTKDNAGQVLHNGPALCKPCAQHWHFIRGQLERRQPE